jgi:hypothetical protein
MVLARTPHSTQPVSALSTLSCPHSHTHMHTHVDAHWGGGCVSCVQGLPFCYYRPLHL